MHTHDYVLLALAALIVAAAFALLPDAAATSEPMRAYQIDISGLNRNAVYLPEEDFPAH